MAAPFDAARLLRRTPELLRLTKWAVAMTALFFAVLLYTLWHGAPWLLSVLWARPEGAWQWLWYPVLWVFSGVLFLLAAQTLPTLVLMPLCDKLSFETERAIAAPTANSGSVSEFVRETARSLRKALTRILLLIAGHCVLLPLWVVPGAGHAGWTVLSSLWSMFWLAYEYVDIAANRHGLGFRSTLKLILARPVASLVFGALLYGLLWVPFLNLLFMPISVVAGTLVFAKRSSPSA